MISSEPIGASALGHCGVQLSLTGVWFPQDSCNDVLLKEKVRKIGKKLLCVAVAESLS